MTQTELAFSIGVSFVTVNRWESGKARPSQNALRRIEALRPNTQTSVRDQRPFRPIQYLGSKMRLAGQIAQIVHQLAPAGLPVCDLFCGSGVVSRTLAERHDVIAVDVQKYSSILANALLNWPSDGLQHARAVLASTARIDFIARAISLLAPLLAHEELCISRAAAGDPEWLCNLVEFGSIYIQRELPFTELPVELRKPLRSVDEALRTASDELRSALVTTIHYGGVYFTYKQAIHIDAIAADIRRLRPAIHEPLIAILLSVASDVVNTVGKQFAQPMRMRKANGLVKPLLVERTLRDRQYSILDGFASWAQRYTEVALTQSFHHTVHCCEVDQFLKHYDGPVGCFYADPPYTIDHYSRFYHVLETIARGDHPKLATMQKAGIMQIMQGLYRVDRYQSPFCIPSQTSAAFQALFAAIKRFAAPLILSYSPYRAEKGHRPRLLTLEQLISMASTMFKEVTIHVPSKHVHRKLNSKVCNTEALENSEAFIICR